MSRGRKRIAAGACLAAALCAGAAAGQERPYEGQEARDIAALSEADLAALRAGEGWGLAISEELNGYPGPRHVLDHAEALDLSPDQRGRVEAIFARMEARARARGADYIEAEAALDAAFEAGGLDADRLAELTAEAEARRGDLRRTHLAAHLETRALLSRHQIMTYDRLRGYGAGGDHGADDHQGHGAERGESR